MKSLYILKKFSRGKTTKNIFSIILLLTITLQPVAILYAEDGIEVITPIENQTEVTETVTNTENVKPVISSENTRSTSDNVGTEEKAQTLESFINQNPEIPPEVKLELQNQLTISSQTQDSNPYNNSNFTYRKNDTLKADIMSGALSYSYKIDTPKGRVGIEPDLKIVYNSSENSNVNMIGFGWDFNIPKIDRLNKQGFKTMYDQDYFSSSLSGELASTSESGVYVSRIESGEFLKYFYDKTNQTWKIYDKGGNIYTLGSKRESRKTGPMSHLVSSWILDEIKDSKGNFISYKYIEYTEDGRQMYPKEIAYTNFENSSGQKTDGIFKILFTYDESRLDRNVTSYQPGFHTKNELRLKTVQIFENNSLRKKYDFVYDTGVNGFRSILKSITETGYDKNGTEKTLPPTTFDYTKGFENPALAPGLEPANYSGSFTYGLNSLFYGPDRGGKIYTDLNGDGYTDSLLSSINPTNTNSFESHVEWNSYGNIPSMKMPYLSFAYVNNGSSGSIPVDQGSRIADFNSDGFSDMLGIPTKLCIMDCPTTPMPKTLYTFNPNSESIEDFYVGTTTNLLVEKGSVILNTNGTGIPSIKSQYVGPGTGAIDINADGLDDLTETNFHQFSLTTGFSLPKFIQAPTSSIDQWYNDMGVRFIDINADGLIDILRGWSLPVIGGGLTNAYPPGDYNEVYINNGDGFVRNYNLQSPYFIKITPWNWEYFYRYEMTDYYDTNGDTIVDLPNAPTTRADLLKQIKYPEGGQTDIEYTTTTGGKKLNPKLPNIMWIVSKITNTDNTNNVVQNEKYTYENGLGFFNGPYDRKFAGFEKVTKEDDSSVVVSYFHQGNGDKTEYGETGDSYAKIGSAYKTEIFDKNGQIFARNQNVYSESSISGANSSSGFASSSPKFVYLSKKIEENFAGNNHKDKAIEYIYDTSNGNLLSAIDFGEVVSESTNATALPVFLDTGNDKLTTEFEYASNINSVPPNSKQIHYEKSRQTQKRQDGEIVSNKKSYFDNQTYGLLTKGNETKNESLIENGNWATTESSYNEQGLVISSKDANGNTTNFTYDSFNLYPITISNPLLQNTNYEYDYSTGQQTKITDVNNQVYTKSFDGLGRIIEEKIPDGTSNVASPNSAPVVVKKVYEYNDTPSAFSVKMTEIINDTISKESISHLDGFGRTIQTRTQSENPSVFIAIDTVYDSNGKIRKQSLPYFSEGIQKTSLNQNTDLFTAFDYDALLRNTKKTNTLGIAETIYSPWQYKTIDQLGNQKEYFWDSSGRLIQVDENNFSQKYSTKYEYDALGNLIKITDALGNIRNFAYDLLGRRIYAEDLHRADDLFFGSYSFKYDDNGNLVEKIDPNGTRTLSSYDALNRLKKTEVSSSPISEIPNGVRVSYLYDSCDFGIGKLCSVSYYNELDGALVGPNTTSYLYNPAGQTKNEIFTIDGNEFKTDFEYTKGGNLAKLKNASSTVSYLYNSANLIDSVSFTEISTTTTNTLIGTIDYAPTGQIASINYGNGSITTNTYDSSKLYRLINKKTLSTGNLKLQDLNYTYDAVGNILEIQDNSDTNTKGLIFYSYDNLYRLINASTTPFEQSFEYDALGNIQKKIERIANIATSTLTIYKYEETGYANPHAPTKIGSTTEEMLSYDKNGNLVSFGKTKYKYDYANRLLSVSDGLATSTYSYDHKGSRVGVLDNSGETTLYPSDYFNQKYNKEGLPILTSVHIFGADTLLSTFEHKTPVAPKLIGANKGTCVIPNTGDFTLSSSCTIIGEVEAPASIIVPNGKVLTITKDSSLYMNLKTNKLLVKKGGGVLVKQGANLRQTPIIDTTEKSILNYHLTDHLGSISLSTDTTGNVSSLTTFYPYGKISKEENVSGNKEQRGYIGEEFDRESGLSYLNARYYDGGRGQFLSQDPVFFEVGTSEEGKEILSKPQLQNSYSYAGGNPIINKDPSGRYLETALDLVSLGLSVNDYKNEPSLKNAAFVGLDSLSTVLPVPAFVGYVRHGGDAVKGFKNIEKAEDRVKNVIKIDNKTSWPGPENGKQIIDGIEYTQHALARMAPKEHVFIDKLGQKIEGRGIPPSVVKNAIEKGQKNLGNTSSEIKIIYQNIRVIVSNNLKKVISANKIK